MREEYDFSNSVANPYVKKARKQVTMNLDVDVIDRFFVEHKTLFSDAPGVFRILKSGVRPAKAHRTPLRSA